MTAKPAISLDELTLAQLSRALRGHPQDAPLFPEAQDGRFWRQSRHNEQLAPLWEWLLHMGGEHGQRPITALPYSDFASFGSTGDRMAYQDSYFLRRSLLAVYALLYLGEETDKDKWLGCLENMIWAICDEYTWVVPAHIGVANPAHPEGVWGTPAPPPESVDLFAGETAFALAEIISLLGGRLAPWVVHRARQEIDKRIVQVLYHNPTPQLWERLDNNWPAVCASCVGAVALYTAENPEQLAGMLWRLIPCFRQYIAGFGPDGATHEGLNYWQFGFGYFVYFAELLRQRTGGSIDLLQGEHISRIAVFANACILSQGKLVNFSDAPDRLFLRVGLFHQLRCAFPDVRLPQQLTGNIGAAAERGWAALSRDLLWAANKEGAAPSSTPLEQHFYFPHVAWAVSQYTVDGRMFAFAARGGHNGESHNHNDLGHFIVHADGDNVLADLGAGLYTRQYFGGERYQVLNNGSHGHSVPIIDGALQSVGGSYCAQTVAYEAQGGCARFVLDLTRAYDCPKLLSLVRSFEWGLAHTVDEAEETAPEIRDAVCGMTVRDRFRLESAAALTEVLIATSPPELVRPGMLRIGRGTFVLYDASALAFELDHQRLPDHYGCEIDVFRILLHVRSPETGIEVTFRIICK